MFLVLQFLALSSIVVDLRISDDQVLWNAVVAGAKANLDEADYTCEFSFKGGLARTFDQARLGNFERVSDAQLFDTTRATGRIVKHGDLLRYKIDFENPTDYHDNARSYSMRSDDQMTGNGFFVSFVPPQRNIFVEQLSKGVVSGLHLGEGTDRFHLPYHNGRLNDSPMWGSRKLLNELSPQEGHDPIDMVATIERNPRTVRFRIESRDFPWKVVEFDTNGEYPVLKYLGISEDSAQQMSHYFEDIRDNAVGHRIPLVHRYVSEPREISGANGQFWDGSLWTATEFAGESTEADFRLEWPQDTVITGQLPRDINQFSLFSLPAPDSMNPINDQSTATGTEPPKRERDYAKATTYFSVMLIGLIIVVAILKRNFFGQNQ
jgi:hypothetical protein